MYKTPHYHQTSIRVNASYIGETIEKKVARVVENKEPITDGAHQIYTDRKDGVIPEYDVRTDRWEIALDAMDKVTRSQRAKREQAIGERTYDTMTPEQQKAFNEKFPKNKHNQNGGAESSTATGKQ